MAHRLSPEAESDLDAAWHYTATESGSSDAADRLIEAITNRFLLLQTHPQIGRRRDEELRPGIRTFPVGNYLIVYRLDGDDVLILRVLRGSRNIEALLKS